MADGGPPVLRVRDLEQHFATPASGLLRRRSDPVRAVDGISFEVGRGRALGLVGETGSGKSTTARAVTRLLRPTAGRVEWDGVDVTDLSGRALAAQRHQVQMIFQDPYGSLNPRHRVGTLVGAPLRIHRGAGEIGVRGSEVRGRVQELLELVGLDPDQADRYPHEFSGGQRQRIAIARALARRPALVVADEPVSALDASLRAQVVNLLRDVQREFGLAYLFISHDIAVVRHLCPEIAVMHRGRIVEIGDRDSVCDDARHPYTQALLAAVPDAAALQRPRGAPRPAAQPADATGSASVTTSGCRFRARCPLATELCAVVDPPLVQVGPQHRVACHFADRTGTPSPRPQPT